MSDEMAIGALRALRERHVEVPAEVSVVGFDDHDLAEMVGLTTVHQPAADLGTRAARLLLDAIDDGGAPPPTPLVLPTRLVRRATCARLTTHA
jgi:DNA-binding LacI/PurR family transcriptional regulator